MRHAAHTYALLCVLKRSAPHCSPHGTFVLRKNPSKQDLQPKTGPDATQYVNSSGVERWKNVGSVLCPGGVDLSQLFIVHRKVPRDTANTYSSIRRSELLAVLKTDRDLFLSGNPSRFGRHTHPHRVEKVQAAGSCHSGP